jgi:serine/threonine-protein kinase RsbT
MIPSTESSRNPLVRETRKHSFEIKTEADVVTARTAARTMLARLGCSVIDKTRIATAVSELARNTLIHGGGGSVEMEVVHKEGKTGIRCIFTDKGPGIEDVENAMENGVGSDGRPGNGLQASQQMVDEFRIDSRPGVGTRVDITKWV